MSFWGHSDIPFEGCLQRAFSHCFGTVDIWAGVVMMSIVAAGWLKFRDRSAADTAHASKRVMVEERLRDIGVGNYGPLIGGGVLLGMRESVSPLENASISAVRKRL
jgi:hypothetical protein